MQVRLSHFTQPFACISGASAGIALFRLSLSSGGLPVLGLAYAAASGVGLAVNRVALMSQQPLPNRQTAAKVVLVSAVAGLLVAIGGATLLTGTLLLAGSSPITAVANALLLANLCALGVSAATGAFPSLYGRVQRWLS